MSRHFAISPMNVVLSFIQSKLPQRRRHNSDPDILEPSVTVTEEEHTLGESTTSSSSRDEAGLSFLYKLCKRWAWPAVVFRAQECPQEASIATDKNGDTLLHWTCFGSPPTDVVQALLEANPKLVRVANRNTGNLPLHVACSYRASSQVIRILVQAFPESVDWANARGSHPLHILCDYGCAVDSLRAILEVSVQSITLRDRLYCRKPLLILNERKNMHEFHDSLHTLRMANALGNYQTLPGLTKDTLLARCRRMTFWIKACMLIAAEHSNQTLPGLPQKEAGDSDDSDEDDDNDDATTTGIVHACLQIQECPPALLEFAVLVQAQELLLPDLNSGRLPLHVAVQQCNVTTILDLLHAQPKAARIPDPSGKLALQVLLHRFPDSPWAGVLDQVVSANPLALESLDLDRRLYPLIWARWVLCKDFDSIFESLRGNPVFFPSTKGFVDR